MKHILSAFFLVFVLVIGCNRETIKINSGLPIFGSKKVIKENDTLYHCISDFEFTNQFGEKVNSATVKNKIYVADFFFATCQSICPVMSRQMHRVQDSLISANDFLILSHTVNPMHDSVEVLRSYGNKYGAIKNKWHLLTGDKKTIYNLGKSAYLINAIEDDGTEEGFLHSELFLLIDRKGRIRGFYDGTDSLAVNQLINDAKILIAKE
jgi:protein SCO1/2